MLLSVYTLFLPISLFWVLLLAAVDFRFCNHFNYFGVYISNYCFCFIRFFFLNPYRSAMENSVTTAFYLICSSVKTAFYLY